MCFQERTQATPSNFDFAGNTFNLNDQKFNFKY